MDTRNVIGFIGLGVMGEPMCRNMARKTGRPVMGFDRDPAPLERLASEGVKAVESITSLAKSCATIFLVLPSGKHVEEVCTRPDGLLTTVQPGTLVVDLGTSPVALTRELAERFSQTSGARYVDAPIARTRQAAEEGTLSIMVGASEPTFAELAPLLNTIASEVTHCGQVGSGQIVKILNNMVLVQTVVALSEAIAIARSSGLDDRLLFETLMKGSADSFALRNHGMKSVLPRVFPERAFSTDYALKDLGYAVALAESAGVRTEGLLTANKLLKEASQSGYGDLYWPAVSKVIGS